MTMWYSAVGCIMMLTLSLLTAPLAADAQQPGKVYRLGLLSNTSPSETAAGPDPFLQGLRELGWLEGENLVLEYRYAEGNLDRLPELAAELVRLKVDVLAANGTPGVLALKRATTTIPIVMLAVGDPVGTGLVASLARPGGNITGLSIINPDLWGKRLQLLQEVVPGVSRVAVLWNAANPLALLSWRATEAAGRSLGVTLQSLEVRSADNFDSAFQAATRGRAEALRTVGIAHAAQFIAVCSASNLAEARGISSPLQGSSLAKTRAFSRPSRAYGHHLRPSTNWPAKGSEIALARRVAGRDCSRPAP
jgi:putative ABC transport system substrate-binding protein